MDRPLFTGIQKIKDPLGFHRVKVYHDENILKYILSLRIDAQSKKQDSLYLVCAREGGGKSLFTLLAYQLYCELKSEEAVIDNVTRNVDELMARYAELKRNAFITLDEAQELASDRWNEKKAKEIKEKFTVMRERAFISMICYPNPLKVSIYFREDRIRGVFFIKKPGLAYYYANSMDSPHFTEILDTWNKYNKTRSINKFPRYAPDFIMHYPEYKGQLREDYNQRKDANITTVLDRNITAKKPDNYLTVAQASARIGITPQAFHTWMKKGKIQEHIFGCNRYFLTEDVDNIKLMKINRFKRYNNNDALNVNGIKI